MSAQKLAELARARALKLKRRRQAATRARAQRRRGKKRTSFWITLAVAPAFMLAGCAAKPKQPTVAIMTPCTIETPSRPNMPTEDLPADVTLDDFVKSAIAEIERREGYEQLLLQSLIFCKSGVNFK